MTDIIGYFKTITAIPHCSGSAEALFDFLVAFARDHGYEVHTDAARNILASRGKPSVCLQSHYDMVCMGRAPVIETVEADGWMQAADASLGADNGIGVAMMMALMAEGVSVELLFTSDEEIGLIGAGALALRPRTAKMLNLDSEAEGVVTIGCAGGADILGTLSDAPMPGTGVAYEVAVRGLPGGHSGVDIDQGIPSAIKVLFDYLHDQKVDQIASVVAGQRRNAIPSNAAAIVRSTIPLVAQNGVQVRALSETPGIYPKSRALIAWVHAFDSGVRTHNAHWGIPQSSINLAMIHDDPSHGGFTIETSARAMRMESLDQLVDQTVVGMIAAGMTAHVTDKYPAWEPRENDWTRTVAQITQQRLGHVAVGAIHAGLECGILHDRFPHIDFASIGPTIAFPHSTRERVDLASVARTYAVVRAVVATAS